MFTEVNILNKVAIELEIPLSLIREWKREGAEVLQTAPYDLDAISEWVKVHHPDRDVKPPTAEPPTAEPEPDLYKLKLEEPVAAALKAGGITTIKKLTAFLKQSSQRPCELSKKLIRFFL